MYFVLKEFFFFNSKFEQYMFSLEINTKKNVLMLGLETHLPERILAVWFYYVE